MLDNRSEYLAVIQSIKEEISNSTYKAVLSVNSEMILLYYHIGKIINEHKSWGSKFIENLAKDLSASFPNEKGYSFRNLKYMSQFAELYTEEQFGQQAVAQIPWGHNVVLMSKVKDSAAREWYIAKQNIKIQSQIR